MTPPDLARYRLDIFYSTRYGRMRVSNEVWWSACLLPADHTLAAEVVLREVFHMTSAPLEPLVTQ